MLLSRGVYLPAAPDAIHFAAAGTSPRACILSFDMPAIAVIVNYTLLTCIYEVSMVLRRCLSSLRSTFLFMACFGIFIGALFPLYSWCFFGARAFTPLYVIGCITAGLIVGTFCYLVIKHSLKLHAEKQWLFLRGILGEDDVASVSGDGFQQLIERNEGLIGKVVLMEETVSRLAGEVCSRHGQMTLEFGRTVAGTEKQTLKEKETLKAVDEMNVFFNDLLKSIEDIAARTEERASISTQMSATTDAIAQNIKDYSASVIETSVSIEEMALSIKETACNVEALTAFH